MPTVEYSKGLEGVVVAESAICKIDGNTGKLYYRGYSITDLVEKVDFEEVIYLLLHDDLPGKYEHEEFLSRIRPQRGIGPEILEIIENFPKDVHPMELLQSIIPYLNAYGDQDRETGKITDSPSFLNLVLRVATVVAAYYRISENLSYIPPRDDLGFGANFLYMLRGEEPSKIEGDIMDSCFSLHAEHHLNVSTFTARVVASTNSKYYCAIAAAIGALYGTLHGGANEEAMKMVLQISSPSNAETWVNECLAAKKKIMGMGHRVYKVKDPRAVIMEDFLDKLSRETGNDNSYRILKIVEESACKWMKQKGVEVYPNVDFFSGSVYNLLGIPSKLFTPIFAASRVSGWVAHIVEQQQNNRLYRPTAIYTGPEGKIPSFLSER